MSDDDYTRERSPVTGGQTTPQGVEQPVDDAREMPSADSAGRKDQTSGKDGSTAKNVASDRPK